jgi:hypothetical protein
MWSVETGSHAVLVFDGAGYHVAIIAQDNITLVSLPPYALELNPLENVWETPIEYDAGAVPWRLLGRRGATLSHLPGPVAMLRLPLSIILQW